MEDKLVESGELKMNRDAVLAYLKRKYPDEYAEAVDELGSCDAEVVRVLCKVGKLVVGLSI